MKRFDRIDWEDLKIAAALARTGTYSGAAAELRVDATTVARRIARLEAEFPFALFQAVDGRREPTARGREALAHVDAMAGHAAAIGAIPAVGAGVTGHVRVAATPAICDLVLAPRAAALLEDNPGLTLSILASGANVNISRYETDIAIRLARPRRGGFVIRKLSPIPLVLCEPADESLADDAIVCAYPDGLDDTPETGELARLGLGGKARFISDSARAIQAVAASGRAVAVLPSFGDAPLPPSMRRTRLEKHREVWLLIQPHLKNDAAARLVADWIADCLGRMRG